MYGNCLFNSEKQEIEETDALLFETKSTRNR